MFMRGTEEKLGSSQSRPTDADAMPRPSTPTLAIASSPRWTYGTFLVVQHSGTILILLRSILLVQGRKVIVSAVRKKRVDAIVEMIKRETKTIRQRAISSGRRAGKFTSYSKETWESGTRSSKERNRASILQASSKCLLGFRETKSSTVLRTCSSRDFVLHASGFTIFSARCISTSLQSRLHLSHGIEG